jgi:hypothetical protein
VFDWLRTGDRLKVEIYWSLSSAYCLKDHFFMRLKRLYWFAFYFLSSLKEWIGFLSLLVHWFLIFCTLIGIVRVLFEK